MLTIKRRIASGEVETCFLNHADKLWPLASPLSNIAVSFFGTATAGIRSAGDLIREWSRGQTTYKEVETVARELHAFISSKGLTNTCFCVAGYDATGYFGRVFQLALPGGVTELHPHATYGLTLGGMQGVAQAVMEQLSVPFTLMPVGSAALLATWLIETTIKSQEFSFGPSSVGGAARIAVLERNRAVRIL